MGENEWLVGTDAIAMLQGLTGRRALRLFAVAGCRRIWHLLTDERSRRAVEVAERYADGNATEEEREAAFEAAIAAQQELEVQAYDRVGTGLLQSAGISGAAAAGNAVGDDWTFDGQQAELFYLADNPADALHLEKDERGEREHGTRKTELAVLATLILRDIFGNPYRPVAVDPAWLAWNDAAVKRLAAAIYEQRAFDRLPILADALEDAGCTDPQFLEHCRGNGQHVRGCFVIDLLLEKS